MKKLFVFLISLLLLIPSLVYADSDKTIDIYLFHQETCPHCKEEIEYLNDLQKEDQNISVHLYEVSKNKENSALLKKVQTLLNKSSNYIPYTVIGSKIMIGFSASTKLEIENTVKAYRNSEYIDIVGGIIDGSIDENNVEEYIEKTNTTVNSKVSIPLLGEVEPKDVSIPLVAVIIGLVDGFNPCAMWVLILLISMLLGLKDKKKMLYLGSVFIVTSALIYMLFMMAWLKVITSFTGIRWVQIIIALVALIGAVLNIRSYLKERKKDSGCEVVDDKKRKKIFTKIRKFTSEKSILLATIGVIALAVSVNVVELACSAGLPVLFTNILAINNVSGELSSIYILIYIFFFMLDDLIVFNIALFTLQITGVTTKYTKYTHLIGGIIMLLIGILLIIKPEWVMFNF